MTQQLYLVGVHDAEGFLELLDGTLREHGENIAAALLGFPANNLEVHVVWDVLVLLLSRIKAWVCLRNGFAVDKC